MARTRTRWQDTWDDFCLWMGLHGFSVEVPFRVGKSTYRLDFAMPEKKLCIEYDGLGRGGEQAQERGGHETRSGLLRDARKSNALQLAGWVVLRCHAPTIESGQCQAWIEQALRRS